MMIEAISLSMAFWIRSKLVVEDIVNVPAHRTLLIGVFVEVEKALPFQRSPRPGKYPAGLCPPEAWKKTPAATPLYLDQSGIFQLRKQLSDDDRLTLTLAARKSLVIL